MDACNSIADIAIIGYFLHFYYKVDELINVLRAEFKFLEVYTSLQNTCLFPYPYAVTACELSLSAVKYSVCL